ncbi:cystathionine beta-lyase [Sphaerosporella brunnea]|uniref:Cystathionine beta-lyase n=1 Tax=Sphaerosporella brunnea TaxID=1250544 RepID=A0A5J5F8Z1_9PEZI|nr:cystathionine beta-lyase [Sphaerosporella brunnea]
MSQLPASLANLNLAPATLAVHADEHLTSSTDIAPPLHVSTTFRYASQPEDLIPFTSPTVDSPPLPYIYSRLSAPSTNRLETVLSSLIGAETVVYPSGLAAFHALLTHVNPKRLLITDGYHGCHNTAKIISRLSGMEVVPLSTEPKEGDLVHLETPLNPTGEALSIQELAEKAHKAGAKLSVDSTLAPPPLQDPFAHGADFVMHSGTKYFGGHSDMLAGTLSVKSLEEALVLRADRMYLGAIMGNMEAWLGLRSVKTLELRVSRQSSNATALAGWLHSELQKDDDNIVKKVVGKVTHASLQSEEWIKGQMPGGFSPVFSVWLKNAVMAKTLPSMLRLWGHATSLGGVESLIEWRSMTDAGCDRSLLRLSVGVENVEDLKGDLLRGFEAVVGL